MVDMSGMGEGSERGTEQRQFSGVLFLEVLVCNREDFGLMASHLYNVQGGEWFALSSSGALLAAMQKIH